MTDENGRFRQYQLQPRLDVADLLVGDVPSLKNGSLEGQPWAPEMMMALLFAQPSDPGAPRLSTFMIVDGAARKIVNDAPDLINLRKGLRAHCLFNGKAARDLAEVAPYIVDISMPLDVAKRNRGIHWFLRDFFQMHWRRNTAIILRTASSMNRVRRHFRRFTRVRDEAGKWFYFRFFDPRVASDFFSGMRADPDRVMRWFVSREGDLIDALMMEHPARDGYVKLIRPVFGLDFHPNPWSQQMWSVEAVPQNLPFPSTDWQHEYLAQRPTGSYFFTEADREVLVGGTIDRRTREMTDRLMSDFPDRDSKISRESIYFLVKEAVERYYSLGFRNTDDVYLLTAFDYIYGRGYEVRDRTGRLGDILYSDLPPRERLRDYKIRMQEVFG